MDGEKENEALTFREWYVLMDGHIYLDSLPEEEAERKISQMTAGSKTAGVGSGGKSAWLKECTPGCLCHEDCSDRGCVYGSARRDATSRKPAGIFSEKPASRNNSGYRKKSGRTLPAGAEGYGNRGGSRCIDRVIDEVTNGYCD